MDILSLEFEYKSNLYRALVRTKILPQEKQYHITVMNGDLEKMLYGHHIISGQKDLRPEEQLSPEVAELKQCIARALENHLQRNGMMAGVQSQMN